MLVDRDTGRAWLTRFERGDVAALPKGRGPAGPESWTRPHKKRDGLGREACQQQLAALRQAEQDGHPAV
jgi:hypothetical protein